jgi:hypothetical protein
LPPAEKYGSDMGKGRRIEACIPRARASGNDEPGPDAIYRGGGIDQRPLGWEEPSRRIVKKLGFNKLGIDHQAATRCFDGAKLDRHEYILTSPDAIPQLEV